MGLVVIVAGTWWFGIRDAGSDPADVIQGTWYWAEYDAYETFDGDGEWSVREGLEGGTFDWGTYTFEGGVLTLFNAEGSYCSGAVAAWEVTFSEDENELHETFVEDSCTGSVRGQDRVVIRHSP